MHIQHRPVSELLGVGLVAAVGLWACGTGVGDEAYDDGTRTQAQTGNTVSGVDPNGLGDPPAGPNGLGQGIDSGTGLGATAGSATGIGNAPGQATGVGNAPSGANGVGEEPGTPLATGGSGNGGSTGNRQADCARVCQWYAGCDSSTSQSECESGCATISQDIFDCVARAYANDDCDAADECVSGGGGGGVGGEDGGGGNSATPIEPPVGGSDGGGGGGNCEAACNRIIECTNGAYTMEQCLGGCASIPVDCVASAPDCESMMNCQ